MRLSNYRLILLAMVLLAGCSNNSKKGKSNAVSIHNVWVFAKLTPASAGAGPVWIGGNVLDIRRKDTLLFAYKNAKVPATKYAYKISKDTLYIAQEPAYKILSITSDTLKLETIFRSAGAEGKAPVVLVYAVK